MPDTQMNAQAEGGIGRLAWMISMAVATALMYAAVHGSFLLLAPLAELLAPHGINAGTIQNAILIGGAVVALLIVWMATHRRLRAIGERGVWAPLVLLPPAVLMLVDGPLFLRPLYDVPDAMWWGVLCFCGLIGAAVFLNCALRPGVAGSLR